MLRIWTVDMHRAVEAIAACRSRHEAHVEYVADLLSRIGGALVQKDRLDISACRTLVMEADSLAKDIRNSPNRYELFDCSILTRPSRTLAFSKDAGDRFSAIDVATGRSVRKFETLEEGIEGRIGTIIQVVSRGLRRVASDEKRIILEKMVVLASFDKPVSRKRERQRA